MTRRTVTGVAPAASCTASTVRRTQTPGQPAATSIAARRAQAPSRSRVDQLPPARRQCVMIVTCFGVESQLMTTIGTRTVAPPPSGHLVGDRCHPAPRRRAPSETVIEVPRAAGVDRGAPASRRPPPCPTRDATAGASVMPSNTSAVTALRARELPANEAERVEQRIAGLRAGDHLLARGRVGLRQLLELTRGASRVTAAGDRRISNTSPPSSTGRHRWSGPWPSMKRVSIASDMK